MKKINYSKSKYSRFKCCTLTLCLDGVIIGEMENGWEKSKKKTVFRDIWFKGEEWGNFGKAQEFYPWAHWKMITPNKGNNCFWQKCAHPNVPFLGLFVFFMMTYAPFLCLFLSFAFFLFLVFFFLMLLFIHFFSPSNLGFCAF